MLSASSISIQAKAELQQARGELKGLAIGSAEERAVWMQRVSLGVREGSNGRWRWTCILRKTAMGIKGSTLLIMLCVAYILRLQEQGLREELQHLRARVSTAASHLNSHDAALIDNAIHGHDHSQVCVCVCVCLCVCLYMYVYMGISCISNRVASP